MIRHVFNVTFGLLFCFASYVHAQPSWSSIVRVADGAAVGSGFIVAVDDMGTAEIWTNAHVAGANSTPTIRFGTSGLEATATVVEWKLDRSKGVDVCKLLVKVPRSAVVTPLVVGVDSGDLDGCTSSGWKLGSQLSMDAIRRHPEQSQVGASYDPSPVVGQSGGPIVNREGEVVGVVTWSFSTTDRRFSRAKQFGVAQPISNFTGEVRFVPKAQTVPPKILPREIGTAKDAN